MATSQDGLLEETRREIQELKVDIRELETPLSTDEETIKRNDTKISDKTRLLIAKTELLTALIRSQQGNSSGSSHFSFAIPNLLDVILRPILFRQLLFIHSGSVAAQGKS